MARPQQSTIIKASDSQNCNSTRTYGPGKKNFQSTKHVKSKVEVEEDIDFYLETESMKTHVLCATIIPFNLNIKGFSYISGAFPHKSRRGNLYFMVMYDYDRSAILA